MHHHPAPTLTPSEAAASKRSVWPLWGACGGVIGFVGTVLTDVRPLGKGDGDSVVTAADMTDLSRLTYHIGVIAGYATVVALLIFAAAWRRHTEQRMSSTAAHVVSNGLIAAAGALTLGYGFKGAMAIYLPGGIDAGGYDADGLFVYFMLNDFGAYLGWVGVLVAAGGIVWMSFAERTVSRWIGAVSVLAIVPPLGFLVVTGLPGFPGVVGGLWLAVAGFGLAFGRSSAAMVTR
jgi:hypothetical protein